MIMIDILTKYISKLYRIFLLLRFVHHEKKSFVVLTNGLQNSSEKKNVFIFEVEASV